MQADDASSKAGPGSVPAALPNLDVQALDLLVQRGERDAELLRGLGLVAVAALQFVDDDAALDVFHDVEERRVGAVLEQARRVAGTRQVAGEQVDADRSARGQHDAALNDVL